MYVQTCDQSIVYSPLTVSHRPNSSTEIGVVLSLGHHAVQGNQSNESSEWLINRNWWIRSSIWNWRPSGMAPPPLLPSECNPRLICTNLINTLTGTPGLFTEGSVAAVVRTRTHMHAHKHACFPDGPLIALMVAGAGWWLHLTQILSHTDRHT